MDVHVYRLKGVEKELKRLNENLELLLVHAFGVSPFPVWQKTEASAEEPEVMYTDEAADAMREYLESVGKVPKEADVQR